MVEIKESPLTEAANHLTLPKFSVTIYELPVQ
jgi:hypothetical protein